MTDSRLRSVLVYRLEGAATNHTPTFGIDDDDEGAASMEMGNINRITDATLLSLLDYAKEYESTGGATTDLYGARSGGSAEAVRSVIIGDPPPRGDAGIGSCRVVDSDTHRVVYGADAKGICYVVIAGAKYSTRAAMLLVADLSEKFSAEFGSRAATAKSGSLSKAAAKLMKATCKKFEDPEAVDKTAEVLGKVEEVRGTMAENIAKVLENSEKMEGLVEQTEVLSEQANEFRKKSTQLKKVMCWKDFKMTIMVSLAVVVLLLIVLMPLIGKGSSKDDTTSDEGN